MRALSTDLRKQLSDAVLIARRASEQASRAALESLGVFADRRPDHLSDERAKLRVGLRAKWRQLGQDDTLLVAECAYEQWHRLLFARFLAENNLLLHPEFRASVTLADCEELADELGEPDGWSVAARFAAEILPGIFRLNDPCVRLRFAPEGRDELERIVAAIPAEVFGADDALGWVYQFWQKDKKDEINNSERKIGGADLGPVTQLFTENYMVRFLLENSLGAWWAARHPESQLVKEFDYLRFDEGKPAAGSFDEWPEQVGGVTVMDPCCGSGHFLVEAFGMLWRMRAEEEGLGPADAQDAVLRDNLFGLELDPRCVQIAMFAVALQAWKAGGGWRELPVPNIACSGVPVKASIEEWTALAEGDQRLENALTRLHILFQDADTLGSLIDPKRAAEISDPTGLQRSTEDVDWEQVAPVLEKAASKEAADPATAVLGADVASVAQAADLLSRTYWLVTTNVPFLHSQFQSSVLKTALADLAPMARADLATGFIERAITSLERGGCAATVSPQNWTFLGAYKGFRGQLLDSTSLRLLIAMGAGAFSEISGEVVQPVLCILAKSRPQSTGMMCVLDLKDSLVKPTALMSERLGSVRQEDQRANPDQVITFSEASAGDLLSRSAAAYVGVQTGDNSRFVRVHWEVQHLGGPWTRLQGTVARTQAFGGRSQILFWEEGSGTLLRFVQSQLGEGRESAWIRGAPAWGQLGVCLSRAGELPATIYSGEIFLDSAAVILPNDPGNLPAVYAYCCSTAYASAVRRINRKLIVTNRTLAKVPFDLDYWRQVAEEKYPDGLPEPYSNDPTQWLFEGHPRDSTAPLQVAVGRLLGYHWPGQLEEDELDHLADRDGIVCLPSVAGEAPAVDQLNALLGAAFGDAWSSAKARQLLEKAESKKKDLSEWLRDEFFKQHCALFGKRPFIWHIWDGKRDGFSALVNYHLLDKKNLERLTFTYLGDWIERQRAAVVDEEAGAEARLTAALDLQTQLEYILEGDDPYDIYVRWKGMSEQPIGWEPDLNDGVRLNIRPFVEAGILRSKFSIHWRKDRGKNPDGSERHNDIHLSLDEKLAAREGVG